MLTPKLQQTYQFIRRFILQRGLAPTEKEIAEGIGIKSRGVVHRYIHELVGKGLLKIVPRKKRNIQLIENPSLHYNHIPVLGTIAAGSPIELIKHDERLDLSDLLLGANRFVLRINDHWLGDENFCCGDYLICERRDQFLDNELVVALINSDQVVLKRLRYNTDKSITLFSPISDDHSMTFPINDVKIEGVYLGMIRFKEALQQE